MHTHTQEALFTLSPAAAFQYLKEGNERFLKNQRASRDLIQQVDENKNGQFPFACILSCMDSRTSAELIFDQGLGDIFSIRVAGNILNEDIVGSMEYAAKAVGVKIIVVLGHTKCGAIIGACDNVQLGQLTKLLDKVKPAIEKESTTQADRNGKNAQFVRNVIELNVHEGMRRIREQSPMIAEMEQAGELKIVGGMYDIETGSVTFYEK